MNLIIFIGIPGCGKSSAVREMAKLWNLGLSSWQKTNVNENGSCFLEPEEKDWPEFARNQAEHLDDFSMMTWFRAIHVPSLYKAEKISKEGKIAIVDNYFDKFTYSYLGKETWLMQPSNKYFKIMERITKLDREELPNPSFLIFMKVNARIIEEFLKRRGRTSDTASEYLSSIIEFQNRLLAETESLCREKKIKLIVFEQEISSPKTVAMKLLKKLENAGFINKIKERDKKTIIKNSEKITNKWYQRAFYWPIWTIILLFFSIIILIYNRLKRKK